MRGGIGFWGASKQNYLLGNAKIYDGTFDYDKVVNMQAINAAYTILFTLQNDSIGRTVSIFDDRPSGFTGDGINYYILAGGEIGAFHRFGAETRTTQTVAQPFGKKTIICTASTSDVTIYVNGVQPSQTKQPVSSFLPRASRDTWIGLIAAGVTNSYMKGLFKQLEVLNRIATPAEILAASNAASFRGAGISHSSGEYLLAVDFDKTGTVAPTTYAGTPTYTITSFGGASYTPYL